MGQIKRSCNFSPPPRRNKRIRTMKLPGDDDWINAVKRKKRERRESNTNVGGQWDSIEIPLDLYKDIMKANTIRKQLETHPDDKNLQCMLDSVEDDIPIFVDYYKDIKVLPRCWKYDPATASTLVPKKSLILTDIDFISSDSPKRHGFSPPPYDLLDTNRKHPNTEVVPLNADEEKIWLQFLEFAKKTTCLNISEGFLYRERKKDCST
uniref:uncharacterized protein LOC122592529 isoform X2 n=1 Tax=Erigeron canadensis TaxID=72917 RepID=UPI001CB96FF2|nr:uncharacterized protein LOC122592529 isoform X2 [Erigeron canadensis]